MRTLYKGTAVGKSGKQAVNLSVSRELLAAARRHQINLSATLESAIEQAIRQRERVLWLTRNAEAMKSYNEDIEKNGAFGDFVRSF